MAKKKNLSGFTLIELLVVIAIIGLLLAIVVPSLNKAKYIARRMICAGRLSQIGKAMKMYTDASKDILPPDYRIRPDNGKKQPEMHGFVVYRLDWNVAGKLIPLRLACLYETGYIDMPEIFYCPNNRDDTYKYESYINPAPWGTLPQVFNKTKDNDYVRIGLTYYPVERNPKLITATNGYLYPDPMISVTKYSSLNINMPYSSDSLHSLSSLSHQYNSAFDSTGNVIQYGTMAVNCLYGDGRVTTCTDMDVFKADKIWKLFRTGTTEDYFTGYYQLFKLIGP